MAPAAAAAPLPRLANCVSTMTLLPPVCSQGQGQAAGPQDGLGCLRRCLGLSGIWRRAGRRCRRLEAAKSQRAAGGATGSEAQSSGRLPAHVQRAAAGSRHHSSHRLVSWCRGLCRWQSACMCPLGCWVLVCSAAGVGPCPACLTGYGCWREVGACCRGCCAESSRPPTR